MACCLTTPNHYTGTNVDLLSVESFTIHLKALAVEMLMKVTITTHLKVALSKSKPHLPGANELMHIGAPRA